LILDQQPSKATDIVGAATDKLLAQSLSVRDWIDFVRMLISPEVDSFRKDCISAEADNRYDHMRDRDNFPDRVAQRPLWIKPLGINVHEKIGATHWFLNGKDDVRSSHYLEDPATEFDIQGLELDLVGVCWDADFRSINGKWAFHRFTGTKWQNVNDDSRKIYLTNAYRVLLTRARQGMVIYIPEGDSKEATRPPAYYDGTAEFLSACGLSFL